MLPMCLFDPWSVIRVALLLIISGYYFLALLQTHQVTVVASLIST